MTIFERALKVAAKKLIVKSTVEANIAAERYKICLGCEFRDEANDQCGVCHCFLDLKTASETNWNPAKLRNEITHCPKGRWNDKETANLYREMDGKEPLS